MRVFNEHVALMQVMVECTTSYIQSGFSMPCCSLLSSLLEVYSVTSRFFST
jgi:hypothetical protein